MNDLNLEAWAEERTKWYAEVDPKLRKRRWRRADHYKDGGK